MFQLIFYFLFFYFILFFRFIIESSTDVSFVCLHFSPIDTLHPNPPLQIFIILLSEYMGY